MNYIFLNFEKFKYELLLDYERDLGEGQCLPVLEFNNIKQLNNKIEFNKFNDICLNNNITNFIYLDNNNVFEIDGTYDLNYVEKSDILYIYIEGSYRISLNFNPLDPDELNEYKLSLL